MSVQKKGKNEIVKWILVTVILTVILTAIVSMILFGLEVCIEYEEYYKWEWQKPEDLQTGDLELGS